MAMRSERGGAAPSRIACTTSLQARCDTIQLSSEPSADILLEKRKREEEEKRRKRDLKKMMVVRGVQR